MNVVCRLCVSHGRTRVDVRGIQINEAPAYAGRDLINRAVRPSASRPRSFWRRRNHVLCVRHRKPGEYEELPPTILLPFCSARVYLKQSYARCMTSVCYARFDLFRLQCVFLDAYFACGSLLGVLEWFA